MEGHKVWETIVLILLLIALRFFYLIFKITTGHSKMVQYKRKKSVNTLICLGSGGHTTEMLLLLSTLDFEKYKCRHYIIASSDTTSASKTLTLEKNKNSSKEDFQSWTIPRSRKVHQSYISSILTTIISIIYSVPLVLKINPDLVLCNGPGTCIPICFVAFLMKISFIKDVRIVFVESFCRTKTLSMSGKILLYIADNFLVQWPYLKNKYKRTEYIGQLL